MKNKYFYPIFKLKAKSWIRYWLLKKTEFKGKLSEILEGFSFNLQNTLRQKFVKFEIEGNSVQNGEPSPENEVPILSAGDDIQLFDISTMIESKFLRRADGQLYDSTSSNTTDFIEVSAENSYTLSYDYTALTSNSERAIVFYNSSKTYLSGTSYNPTNKVKNITTPANTKYVRITLDKGYSNIKIEEGSTATPWSPYGMGSITEKITNADGTEEQTYSIYTQQPFRSIGDVRDVFFKNTVDSPYYDENLILNGWYERHDIKEIIVDGNLDGFHFGYTFSTGAGNVYYKNSEYKLAKSPLSDTITGNILCNRLIAKPEATTLTGIEGISITLRSNAINVTLGGDYLTKELKNAYASENPLIIVFESQDPTNLLCTPEQINVLENIPSTFSGQTNVFSIDEVKAYLKIQYWESDTNG